MEVLQGSYLERVAKNLLPLSNSDTISAALKEWVYLGHNVDHEEPEEVCELCDKKNLRYHFEIEHKDEDNHGALWVGSECIKKFDIGVLVDGVVVYGEEAAKKLDKDRAQLIEETRVHRVSHALAALVGAEDSYKPTIQSMIAYLNKRGCFTPKQMSLIAWRLDVHSIKHVPGDFRISLRRHREQDQVLHLAPDRLDQLWPYFSGAQRRRISEWQREAEEAQREAERKKARLKEEVIPESGPTGWEDQPPAKRAYGSYGPENTWTAEDDIWWETEMVPYIKHLQNGGAPDNAPEPQVDQGWAAFVDELL